MRKTRINSRWSWTLELARALWVVWLCVAEVKGASAQANAVAARSEENFRLLTAAEGRTIVAAALERDQLPSGEQDCSHAVHQIYLDAGFEYAYASSFEIHAGNENFARVKTPRAGDLVAWPGHVGIVVNPARHSFYSLVSTGLDTQDYDGPYWSSRGRARFFRYKVMDSGMATAAKTVPPQPKGDTKKQSRSLTVADISSSADRADSNRPPKAVSERKAVVTSTQNSDTAASSNESAEVLSSILIATASKQPTRDEVAKGVSELSSAAGNILLRDDPWKLSSPVVIVESFTVEKVEVKRDHGWAHLKVASRVFVAGGAAELKVRNEKVNWELRRTKSGWEAMAPKDRTYVPQDVAVRNLAAHLARLTESDGAAEHQETILRQESQLANLLSALLESK